MFNVTVPSGKKISFGRNDNSVTGFLIRRFAKCALKFEEKQGSFVLSVLFFEQFHLWKKLSKKKNYRGSLQYIKTAWDVFFSNSRLNLSQRCVTCKIVQFTPRIFEKNLSNVLRKNSFFYIPHFHMQGVILKSL